MKEETNCKICGEALVTQITGPVQGSLHTGSDETTYCPKADLHPKKPFTLGESKLGGPDVLS